MSKIYQLTVQHHFDAAHRLPHHHGKCQYRHGHRWEVEVQIQTVVTDQQLKERHGMVVDFGWVKDIIDEFDHSDLNDWFSDPTAEAIASSILESINLHLEHATGLEAAVIVTVWESPNCSVTVMESENDPKSEPEPELV